MTREPAQSRRENRRTHLSRCRRRCSNDGEAKRVGVIDRPHASPPSRSSSPALAELLRRLTKVNTLVAESTLTPFGSSVNRRFIIFVGVFRRRSGRRRDRARKRLPGRLSSASARPPGQPIRTFGAAGGGEPVENGEAEEDVAGARARPAGAGRVPGEGFRFDGRYRKSAWYSSFGSFPQASDIRFVKLYIEAISATSQTSSSVRPRDLRRSMSSGVHSRGSFVTLTA